MALLIFSKKTKAASLVETIVASVIIVIIVTIFSLTLNNILKNNYKYDEFAVKNRLSYLGYLLIHKKINKDYNETYLNGDINVICEQRKCNFIWSADHKKITHLVITTNE